MPYSIGNRKVENGDERGGRRRTFIDDECENYFVYWCELLMTVIGLYEGMQCNAWDRVKYRRMFRS